MTRSLRELLDFNATLMPLTIDQYHRMIETGIIKSGSPYELLDGYVIRKDRSAVSANPRTVSCEHAYVVNRLAHMNPRLESEDCFIQTQLPITLPPNHEPEPDASIIRGCIDDYHEHPGPPDVLCVFEVADSSLQLDRTTKLKIYASAGIPQFVIVNLPDRTIEHYTEPSPDNGAYVHREQLQSGDKLQIRLKGNKRITLLLRDLLP